MASEHSLKQRQSLERYLLPVQLFVEPPLKIGRTEGVKQEKRWDAEQRKKVTFRTRVDSTIIPVESKKEKRENIIIQKVDFPPEIRKRVFQPSYMGEVTSPAKVNCYLIGYQAGGPGLEMASDGSGMPTDKVFPGWGRIITGLNGERIRGVEFKAKKWQGSRVLFRAESLSRIDAWIKDNHLANVIITRHEIILEKDAAGLENWIYQMSVIFEKTGIDLFTKYKLPLLKELEGRELKGFGPPVITAIELGYHYLGGVKPTTDELVNLTPLERATKPVYLLPPRPEERVEIDQEGVEKQPVAVSLEPTKLALLDEEQIAKPKRKKPGE